MGKRFINTVLVAVLVFFTSGVMLAQTTINMVAGANSYTNCNVNFYDNGGSGANYTNNFNGVTTFYPTASADKVQISFSAFFLEAGFDFLYVYNGNSDAAPLLGTYTGKTIPPDFVSTATDGSITIKMTSDGGTVATGFTASVKCTTPQCAKWVEKTAIPVAREESTTFAIGDKIYVIGGWDRTVYNNDVWEYNTLTDAWTQLSDFPGGNRAQGVGFSIGNKGYFGLGWDGTTNYSDWWEFDGTTWISKSAYPGSSARGAVGFDNGEFGFVGMGWDGTSTYDTFYKYNPTNNTWTSIATSPKATRYASGFSIGGNGYFVAGLWSGADQNTIYKYDIAGNTWTFMDDMCTATCYTSKGAAVEVNGIGYYIGGYYNSDDIFSYSPSAGLFGAYGNLGSVVPRNAYSTSYVAVKGKVYWGMGYDLTDGASSTRWYQGDITSNPLSLSLSDVDITCNGLCNGSASTTTSSGFTPYTYSWSNAANTQNISGLCTNTYTVTVTDVIGCTKTGSAFIYNPPILVANAGVDVAYCAGGFSSIGGTPAATGGTGSYTYSWSPAGNLSSSTTANPTCTGPTSNSYTITVTDVNGCTSTDVIFATVYSIPAANAGADKIVCGSSTVNIGGSPTGMGGTPAYSYSWSNNGYLTNGAAANPTTTTALPVGATTFTVTVTDSNGCKGIDQMTTTKSSTIILTATTTAVSCYGAADGTITSSSSGGATPYTYLWNDAATTQNRTALAPGTYTVTLTDAISCTSQLSVAITESSLPSVTTTTPITSIGEYSATGGGNVTCNGASAVTQRGVCWNTSSTPTTANNLTYDGAGVGSYASSLTGLTPGTLYYTRAYALNSNGTSYGTQTTFYTFSTEPYGHATPFVASNPTSNSVDLNWTQPGNTTGYIILYKAGASPTATPSDGLAYTAGTALGDATVGAFITSGSSVNATISGLNPGVTYYFTIYPFNKATNSATTNYLTSPTVPSTSEATTCISLSSSTTDVSCFGGSNGSASVTPPANNYVTAGTSTGSNATNAYPAPYGNYYWGAKQQYLIRSSDISSLNRTISSLAFDVVTSNNVSHTNFTIRMKHTASSTISTMDMGSFTTVYSSAGYTPTTGWNTHTFSTPFVWDGASNILIEVCFNRSAYTTNAATRMTNVGYNAAVIYRADNGTVCSSSSVTSTSTSRPNMRLGFDYDYEWSSGSTTSGVTGLVAGTYTLTVTAVGCEETEQVVITEPVQIDFTLPLATQSVSCNGSYDGQATAVVTGGTAPYDYYWSDDAFQSTATATGLNAGMYTVTVDDQNGCATFTSVTISQPSPLIVNTSSTNESCLGACDASSTAIGTGGTPPYSYLWGASAGNQNTATATSLCSGSHDVTITDSNGCTDFDPAFISGPTPMAGYYTVGGTSPNYATINDAINDLECKGVSSSVTIAIRPGVYNEQIEIGNITGASSGNTIYIMSTTNDANDVTISYNASVGSNYTFKLNGAKHISFDGLTFMALNNTYSRVIDFSGSTQYITIMDSKIIGEPANDATYEKAVIYSGGDQNDFVTISGCEITHGSYGVSMRGVSSGARESEFNINSCIFSGQFIRAMELQFMHEPTVNNNEIFSSSGYSLYQGIYCYDCADEYNISANSILANGVEGEGIYINNCNGTGSLYGRLINNIIQIGSSGVAKGINVINCSYQNIYNNTIDITSTDAYNGFAFFATSGSNVNVKNNIFNNSGGGYAVQVASPSPIAQMDYNNLFVVGSNCAIFLGGDYNNIGDWQTNSGFDFNSFSEDPGFVSSSNLRLSCTSSNNMIFGGCDLSCCVSQDIDGESRSVFYSVGADEFETSAALGGIYHIGIGQQYETFNQAVADLVCRGTSSVVTFLVHDGTYNEQAEIPYIAGDNQINFSSFSNDSTKVTLTYAANISANYTLLLNGADYISFNKITIAGTNVTYSRCIELKNGASYNTFFHCRFIGPQQASDATENALVYSFSTNDFGNNFNSNKFLFGSQGAYLDGGGPGTEESNNQFYGNIFENQWSSAIYVNYQTELSVYANDISSGSPSLLYYGIHIANSLNNLTIEKNRIRLANAPFGIYLNQCIAGGGGSSVKVNNNQIYCGGAGASGLYVDFCNTINVFHNSVNMTGSGAAAFLSSGGASQAIVNNVFSNPGGGHCIDINDASAIVDLDFNDHYTPGAEIGYWNLIGNVSDLSTWQSVTGFDLSSIDVGPSFENDSSLYLTCSSAAGLGNGVDLTWAVVFDIDGEARTTTPWMGADEFYPEAPMAGTYTIGGTSPNFATINEAVTQLICRGVSGATYFDIRPGTYNEQIHLFNISGISGTNPVMFRSETNDSTDVIINFSGNVANNYTVKISASYVTLSKLTIEALSSSYGRVVVIDNYGADNTIVGCILNGITTTSTSDDMAVIYTPITDEFNTTVSMCEINNGSFGIALMANSNPDIEMYNYIYRNRLNNQYAYGIYAIFQQYLTIFGNEISTTSDLPGYTGILLYKEGDYSDVSSNVVKAPNVYGIGIYAHTLDAGMSPGNSELIMSNNMVAIGNVTGGRGIFVESSLYLNIYHNSVRVEANDYNNASAFFVLTSDILDVQNNIFAAYGDAYAIDIDDKWAFDVCSYNDLFFNSSYLGNFGGQYTNLGDWQSATGLDFNSISIEPGFESTTNLNLGSSYSPSLKSGFDLTSIVSVDIDGTTRATIPWIGADELRVFYWVSDGGNWSDYSNHWATSSGGVVYYTSAPTSLDFVVFDSGSATGAGYIINMDVNGYCKGIEFSDPNETPVLVGSGSLIVGP